jgi:hypothetical protein
MLAAIAALFNPSNSKVLSIMLDLIPSSSCIACPSATCHPCLSRWAGREIEGSMHLMMMREAGRSSGQWTIGFALIRDDQNPFARSRDLQ